MEARDKASEIVLRVDETLSKFTKTTEKAAASATAAGEKIDSSLLQTASGADAVELATARVEAAQAKLTATTDQQAAAERDLMEIRTKGTASADELAAANDRLVAAEKDTAKATKDLSTAQTLQKDTAKAAADATDAAAGKTAAAGKALNDTKKDTDGTSEGLSKVGKTAGLMGLGLAVGAGYMVKASGDFESSTQHLVTDAGESQKNLAMVQAGMLDIAKATGTTTDQLSAGMYHIESAGFHGKEGLDVLRVAAEGAKVGNADLDTVSKTLTGTLNSYSDKGYSATQMMNALIVSVGAGDMKMEDLASSLGNVAPIAAAAGLSFAEVGGAVSTMTAQNMSAQQATQDLSNTIRNLQKPSDVATKEMASLGLNSNDVSQQLGKRGLTGTLEMLTTAVANHTKGGQVLIDSFKASKDAAADAQSMIGKMPPELQKLAREYLNGSVSAKDWKQDLLGLSPVNAHLMTQFAGVADKTHAFNDLLAKGGPQAQTFNAAMAEMLGGATGLNTALMLTGGRMSTFKDNTALVQKALDGSSASVDNWDRIQGTFNQKMDVAKASLEATAITLGNALLPMVSKLATEVGHILGPIAAWVQNHRDLAAQLLIGAAAVGILVAAVGTVTKVVGAAKSVIAATSVVLRIFKSDAEAAAVASTSMGTATEAAAAETEAANLSAGKFSSSLGRSLPIIGGVIGGAIALGHYMDHLGEKSVDTTAVMNDLTNQLLDVAGGSQKATEKMASLATLAMKAHYGFSDTFLAPIDQGLAQLVSSGHADQAKQALADIDAKVTAAGQSADIFNGKLTKYNDALGSYAVQQREAALSTDKSTGALDINALALGNDKVAMQGLDTATQNEHGTLDRFQLAMSNTQAADSFHSALLRVTDSVNQNGRSLDSNTTAGLANRQAISSAAQEIENFYQTNIDAQKPVGEFGKQLLDQIADLQKTADQAGMSKDAVKRYMDQLGLLKLQGDITTQLTIQVDTSQLLKAFGMIKSVGGHPPMSFGDGGVVPGAPGEPQLIIAHGQEVVLSRDMLAGRVSPPAAAMVSRLGASQGMALAPPPASASGGSTNIYVMVQGNQVLGDQAATQLANKIGRQLATQILPAAGVRIRA